MIWTRVILLILLVSPAIALWGGGSRRTSHRFSKWKGSSRGGGHQYPPSRGCSGTNNYQHTSRNNPPQQHQYPSSKGWSGTNNYQHTSHYSPPQQMHYPGYSQNNLPIYYGAPPVYVYTYRDSGSPYNKLLAGLALYNLGRMSSPGHNYNREYKSSPGEYCKLGIKRDNGDYEETKVGCQIMTSFIIDAETKPDPVHTVESRQEVTSVTTINGTVVNQVNFTTVKDALETKGLPIQVTPKTQCYLIRVSSVQNMKKTVPCGLLQTYAENSFNRNKAGGVNPVIAVLVSAVVMVMSL